MRKLKVLYLPDRGKKNQEWAEDIMLKALIKHTSESMNIEPCYSLEESYNRQDADIIFLHNLSHTALTRKKYARGLRHVERLLKKPISYFYNSKMGFYRYAPDRSALIVGGIRGTQGLRKAWRYIKYFDAVHTSNEYLRQQSIKAGGRNVFVLHPGVDYNRFIPQPTFRPETFTVGWAGDSTKPMKNFHLLSKLGFPVKIATKQHYTPPELMHTFYPQVSAYVYMSTHEGCNRTILEACSCGLPVVTSDAGTVREFIGDEWIIKGDPRKPRFLKEARNLLNTLKSDYDLCVKVGTENRKNIEKFSWPNVFNRFEFTLRYLVNHNWEG
jgi:glycosyltransferase involved in cell wall biosynthesis